MTQLTIVGLGDATRATLSETAVDALRRPREVYATKQTAPALSWLGSNQTVVPLDGPNVNGSVGSSTPAAAARLAELARRPDGVVYAALGDPRVDDPITRLVLELALAEGLAVRLLPARSFYDLATAVLPAVPGTTSLQVLGVEWLRSLATDGAVAAPDSFRGVYRAVDPTRSALVLAESTSPESLWPAPWTEALLGSYPADHPLIVVELGLTPAAVATRTTTVGELDRPTDGRLVIAWSLPPVERLDDLPAFDTLRVLVARLRAPGGCPWDREQTYGSIKKHLIEEPYEAVAALDAGDLARFAEELGDVLLQVVMYAQLGREAGDFTLEDVLEAVNAKLIRRHPHVFGDWTVSDSAEVLRNWERIKRAEKGATDEATAQSSFAGIPEAAPALMRADAVQSRAVRYGWLPPEKLPSLETVASPDLDRPTRLHRLGDLLFDLVAVARRNHLDAEEALRLATNRFTAALNQVLAAAQAAGEAFDQLPPGERARRLSEGLR